MNNRVGMIIILEGAEGTGKTTLAKKLAAVTESGTYMRGFPSSQDEGTTQRSRQLLDLAQRAKKEARRGEVGDRVLRWAGDNLQNEILSLAREGKIVFVDRSPLSDAVYHRVNDQPRLVENDLKRLQSFKETGIPPEVFVLDASEKELIQRGKGRQAGDLASEKSKADFKEELENYREMAVRVKDELGLKVEIIDAGRLRPDEVLSEIQRGIRDLSSLEGIASPFTESKE